MQPIDRKRLFAGVRGALFKGAMTQGQVAGCEAILAEWERRGLTDLRWLAYMLGTVFWECDRTMQPIKEGGSLAYLKGKKYWPWIGRGYVQLTWETNYRKFRDEVLKLFGVDIIADPDAAMRPDAAAYIMFEGMIRGSFTGKKLADYFNGTLTDWLGARRIINGTDRAVEIAGFARQFYAALAYEERPATPPAPPPPATITTAPKQPAASGLFAALLSLFKR